MKNIALFLRYAEGCRCYLEDKGLISREESELVKSGRADMRTLGRIFYVALPGLEKLGREMGKDRLDTGVMRHYYAFEHNKKKFDEGNLICMAFPARILEIKDKECMIELEPVSGKFRVSSGLRLKPGDWAIFHRINLVEKIPEDFALKAAEFLQGLGLGKAYKFPKVAVRYLERLQKLGGSVYA
jgi:hydrogenase maturation factor